ncbi:MAG: xanthine dehydrogenase family protein molybdopterin-binding subunit [Chloroflexota bacterium]|nr:xanthine dehydrogenase family protein molybdopterin-binding subunit [Chloroflexota bacterium]
MTVMTRPPRVAPTIDAPVRAPAPGELEVGRARGLPLRREGPAKLTGEALYTDDMVFPGAWYGQTIRSSIAHARLLGIDLDPDFDWSRVVVLTAKDVPGDNVMSLIQDDQPVLVEDEIRHYAEPVALLAAPDQETLRQAVKRISLRTEPLPAVFDPLVSEQEFAHFALDKGGDVDAALAAADIVIEGTYRVGHQEQLYIENNAMIAVPRPDGGVTIHGSMQCPYYIHKALQRALGLSGAQAVVIQAETGGGFGGKEEFPSVIATHSGMLALRVGKPVRMIYDRHEDLAATTKRHPAIVTHRTGVMRDGTLMAQDIDVVMDGGAYCTLTPVVLSRGTLHAGGPYMCRNVRIRGRAMATNTPPNGAFRGFGAPQTEFAAEMQVNRVAEALGISPLELRRRWAYKLGDTTPSDQVLRESVAAHEVLDRATEAAEFERIRAQTARQRESRQTGGKSALLSSSTERSARGVGLAMAWHGAGFTGSGEVHLASVASIELGADGQIRILTGSTEMGQGTKTIFPQLAAAELGVDADLVDIAPQDTSIVPDSGPTVASRTAMVVGGLVIQAARKMRATIEGATGRPFAESYLEYAQQHNGLRVDQQFEPYPGVDFDDTTYKGDAYPAYGWAACVAEVDVDLDTGEVTVSNVISANDIGHVIHQVLAEGQVEGGTLQGVGYATIEEIKLVDGRYLNDRLATYIIPTALDAPRISSILVEEPFSGAPHGAKGVGELPMDVPAAAVVAAIHDATGAWIHDLPASPERILAALHGITPPPLPGISTVSVATGMSAGTPAAGLDPAPDARTDPQPTRGPYDG